MKCRLGLHDWTRWRRCVVHLTDYGRLIGKVDGQVRECRRCGREKVRP